ncbi:t-complex protein1 eta SU (nucleomorph) [Chroomonas mesostigmatica CCMP1168]|uniref:CCT-eta n=1 Tax=Chroomonas mesostigmatica CCMP1168 TaxID=1195612 RepID=J7GB92_9CRYP|nr:t-complex protein1 eta SU [Chroomonas mesostigmatica CCMP1168]|mmetsp:Transcript_60041/g.147640  ORF Transcript_60041/g.147640 Transcript_60041/m.147640 type:complete len:531 (-) Transcript_60041:861-2453(-)
MQNLQPFFLKNTEKNESSLLKILFNIDMCLKAVAVIKSTLGPSSMDKMIKIGQEKILVTNDGATIMNMIDLPHPVVKILTEITKSQDYEVGDGTTTVCILSAELLKNAKKLIEERVRPRDITKVFKKGALILSQMLVEISEKPASLNLKFLKKILMSCCATSLNSKLISGKRHVFSEIIVNTSLLMGKEFDPNMISVKSVLGGAVNDSFFIKGICFKRPFSYAGFEKQIKKHYYPRLLILNLELEIKAEKTESEARLNHISDYKKIIDAEWSIIYEKLDRISEIKTKAVFSNQAIGDLATQYFSERGMICGGRLSGDELVRISKGTGARSISSISNINKQAIGKCGIIEEKQIGNERFVIILGCSTESITIVLRGGSEKLLDETKRCLNDGIMVVKRVLKNQDVVGGAGAVEMKISTRLRRYVKTLTGKNQIIMTKFAQALEIIPKTICDNAGLDSISIMNRLRSDHALSKCWAGIDLENGSVFNVFENYIWEPTIVKINAIQAATEAACAILSVDYFFNNLNQRKFEKE